jgi:peptidoglycan/xylan/chitin deacetylase (PgdA/CDA1 family)
MPSSSRLLRSVLIRAPIKAALNGVPIGVWQRLFPKDVVIPMYHMVSNDDLPHLKYYAYKNTPQFEADVEFVLEHQRFIGYDELVRRRLHDREGPPNAFLLTFDDGFAECFSVIRPILLNHKVEGVFFVPSGFVDNRSMFFESKLSLCIGAVERKSPDEAVEVVSFLRSEKTLNNLDQRSSTERANDCFSWARIESPLSEAQRLLILYLLSLEEDDAKRIDQVCERLDVDPTAYLFKRKPYMTVHQIRQLANDGFTIGGHGMAHSMLQRMSEFQVEQEIIRSCDTIREVTGQKKVPFSFPYSGEGIPETFLADLLQRYDFVELFFDSGGLRKTAPHIVDRFWADFPDGSRADKTNLPWLLRREWSQRKAWIR